MEEEGHLCRQLQLDITFYFFTALAMWGKAAWR